MTSHLRASAKPTYRAYRAQVSLLATAAALAGLALAAKAVAEACLAGTCVDLGFIELRLAHNSGVAFGVGNRLPAWAVIAVTAAITVAVGVYAWRAAPTAGRMTHLAGAAILAGAVANLADRIGDRVVTDYLHTGWWPAFNLADTLLCLGVAGLLLTSLRRHPSTTDPNVAVTSTTSTHAEETAHP